jgi:predicted amidohydrolase YtcJ
MLSRTLFTYGVFVGALLLGFSAPGAFGQSVADRIFTSVQSNILTMVSSGTNIVRAGGLAFAKGQIIAVGSADAMQSFKGKNTVLTDLGTNALLPGFIDAHSHLFLSADFLSFASVRPIPFTTINSMTGVYQALNAWRSTNTSGIGSGNAIVGQGFDPSNFTTNNPPTYQQSGFPTRLDLDAYCSTNPVILVHYSGHIAVANSMALQLAGLDGVTTNSDVLLYSTNSPVPSKYWNQPNGILLESAVVSLLSVVPPNTLKLPGLLAAAQNQCAAQGITTTQEGAASIAELALLSAAAVAKSFTLDVVAYLQFQNMSQLTGNIATLKSTGWAINNPHYVRGLRFGGIKLILDGTPPAETAWLQQPYTTFIGLQNVPNTNAYYGVSDQPSNAVNQAVTYAYTNNIQVMAHVNGDAALAQYLAAVQSAAAASPGDHRTVAIHSQISQQTQIQMMSQLNIIPSFFPDHIYYFGALYYNTALGPARATNICATGWAKQAGLTFTLHNDTPVFPNNFLMAAWAAVNRVTYNYTTGSNGMVLGPEQAISALDALKAITVNAAYQYGEESQKGTLQTNRLADLVILDQDPTLNGGDLLNRVVIETIKAGTTIYSAGKSK